MSATVIVPTYAGSGRIGDLLDSLAAQTVPHQVVVVDNGSSDGTSRVLAGYPEVDIVRLEQNVGFGRAVNLAAEQADGEALILVNDDCVCDSEFVEAITRPLSGPVVMAAGVMRARDEETVIDTAGMELSPTLMVFDYLHGQELEAAETAPDPIGPSAAAAAFDRDAFIGVGGFDETLFAYWEDVDLVLRMRREGGTCALASGARGVHMHSATLGSGSREKNLLMGFGRAYVLRKWSVTRGVRAVRVAVEEASICTGQALIDRNLTSVQGRVRGFRAGRRSFPYPGDLLDGYPAPSLPGDLGRRLRRRDRIRGLRKKKKGEWAREGLDRELGAREDSNLGGDGATLTVPVPSPVKVGSGNAVFVGGRLAGGALDGRRAAVLVDGEPIYEPAPRSLRPPAHPVIGGRSCRWPSGAVCGTALGGSACAAAARIPRLSSAPSRPRRRSRRSVKASARESRPLWP